MTDDDSDDSIGGIERLIEGLIVLAIMWSAFFEVIQPALASLSPIFAYNPDAYVGRAPDSLAQVALFATILLGLFGYFILTLVARSIVNDDISKPIEIPKRLHISIVSILLVITVLYLYDPIKWLP